MQDDIYFQNLYRRQVNAIPDITELYKKANIYKKKNLIKLVVANVSLLFTSAFIIWIWYFYDPTFVTTKIGIALVILAMVLFIAVYNNIIPFLLKRTQNNNTKDYLNQLLNLKKKQKFLQSYMLNIYFILLFTGICLYLYEFVFKMPLSGGILTYGITLLWIAINWFYFRPRIIKKQEKEINQLINAFKRVDDQFEKL